VENTTPDATCAALGPPVSQLDQLEEKPVLWEHGKIHELPTFPGDPNGGANAINNNGQIIGASGSCSKGDDFALHALLWEHGTFTDLGSLGGKLFNFPISINDAGQVVGQSNLADETIRHAFLWTKNTGMQDLGTLPGDDLSEALSINDAGQVTGASCGPDTCRAFLWQNGVMTDLQTLVPGGGSTFFVFTGGINARGQISAIAFDEITGNCCAFLLTPRNSDSSTASASATTPSSGLARVATSEDIRTRIGKDVRKRAQVRSRSN
jgi:probable HAF family extracellular repeat protein